MSAKTCTRCGHSLDLHGRRGYGACRHGWQGIVALLMKDEQPQELAQGCSCKRSRVRPMPQQPNPKEEDPRGT